MHAFCSKINIDIILKNIQHTYTQNLDKFQKKFMGRYTFHNMDKLCGQLVQLNT